MFNSNELFRTRELDNSVLSHEEFSWADNFSCQLKSLHPGVKIGSGELDSGG